MRYMNNMTTFIIALMTMLECKDGIALKDFADRNGFTLEEAVEFIRGIPKTPFYYYSQIDFRYLYKENHIEIFEDTDSGDLECIDDTLKNRDLSDLVQCNDEFSEDQTIEITFTYLKANIEKFKDMKLIIDIDREKLNMIMNVFLKLDADEELELYKIVNNQDIENIEATKIIKDLLENDCKSKFDFLKDREVIKIPYVSIKENINKIIFLYDLIEEEDIVNIKNKNGNITTSVKLLRVYYDLDAHTWKLEFLRKGNRESIRLDKLNDDIDESIEKSNTLNISKEKIKNITNKVKLRVFHEENAKEKALRYCVKYNMELDVKDEYTDITINVQDDEKFLRWVRTMIPSVVIFEPEKLRQRMLNEIRDWDKLYN